MPSSPRDSVGVLTSAESFQRVEGVGEESLLIHGENSAVMTALLGRFAGGIDLIYLDPPFDVGSDMSVHISFGEKSAKSAHKSELFKSVAYGDHWSGDGEQYHQMMYERLVLCRELLSERGSLYLHCDHRTTAHLRLLLEQVFGRKNYINECIWHYRTGGMPEKLGYGRKHDTIHFVVKDPGKAIWNPQKEKSYLGHRYGFRNIEVLEDEHGLYSMVNLRDVWNIPALRGNQPERVDYPTQKPEALLQRIIGVSSNEDSIVADFFCGSGTTAVAAERLGRRWIACDQGELALHTCRKRLLELGAELTARGLTPRSFRTYDLGGHERKAWIDRQGISTADDYHKLVLEALGGTMAQTSNEGPLQGWHEGSAVHVAPVEVVVDAAYLERLREKIREMPAGRPFRDCICLAWSFEQNIQIADLAGEGALPLRAVRIPRGLGELGRKTPPLFYELPRCKFEVFKQLDATYDVTLQEYVPALPLGQGDRSGRTSSFDYIDLWAVDFDYSHHSHFQYDWFDFRTRRKRTLERTSSAHWSYPSEAPRMVALKVVDVSGIEIICLSPLREAASMRADLSTGRHGGRPSNHSDDGESDE